MTTNSRLQQLLGRGRVEYELIPHHEAFTAREVAQESRVASRDLAKVVVMRTKEPGYLMVAIPGSCHLDLRLLEHITGRRDLELANEQELRQLFPDCEPGTMPPFGGLYGIPLYLDACFTDHEDIYFQAGNHHEVIRMKMSDYERLAWPFAGIECFHERARAIA